MNLPTLRQLQDFLTVIEQRHVGHAAKQCFVAQSTLSVGIQELESILNAQLFERNKRSVMPTPLCISLAETARQILDIAHSLVEQAQGKKFRYQAH